MGRPTDTPKEVRRKLRDARSTKCHIKQGRNLWRSRYKQAIKEIHESGLRIARLKRELSQVKAAKAQVDLAQIERELSKKSGWQVFEEKYE